MIAVEVRDHDRVDRVDVDAGGGEVALALPHRAFAGRQGAGTEAGVDRDELLPVFTTTELNGSMNWSVDRYAACSAAMTSSLLLLRTKLSGSGADAGALGDDGHLGRADLDAIPAGRLLAGERRGGVGRRGGGDWQSGGGTCGDCAGEHGASCEFESWRLPYPPRVGICEGAAVARMLAHRVVRPAAKKKAALTGGLRLVANRFPTRS